jgi:uncharacterized caspase-like protein
MANHWAIAVGISQYLDMPPLPYAKRDAGAFHDYLAYNANIQKVYYLSDDSRDVVMDEGITASTQPTFDNLKQFLQIRFATPFLTPEDTLWFFFSGHGLHYGNQDYLLPSDADPEAPQGTAIAIPDLVHCLQRSGTDKIVLLLDACHTEDQKFGQGFTDPEGVVTFYACDFGQASQTINQLRHGAFTYSLLEGLQTLCESPNVNLGHLKRYINVRLPQLNHQYNRPFQQLRASTDRPLGLEEIAIPDATDIYQNSSELLRVQQTVQLPDRLGPSYSLTNTSVWNMAAGLGIM